MSQEKQNIEKLSKIFTDTHVFLQNRAVQAVNASLVVRNWLFGMYLVEIENAASDRRNMYGREVLSGIARTLKTAGLSGVSLTNLKLFRKFYLVFRENGWTVSDQSLLLANKIRPISTTDQIDLINKIPINARQNEILTYIDDDCNRSIKTLSDILKVSITTIKSDVKYLKKIGILKRIGGTRGYWKISENAFDNDNPPQEALEYLQKLQLKNDTIKPKNDTIKPENDTIKPKNDTIKSNSDDAILIHIREDRDITIKELALRIGVTELTIKRNIKKIIENGKLKRVGSRKTGHWEIIE